MKLSAVPDRPVPSGYAERLTERVRPEFRVIVYRPAPGNPVLGIVGPRCQVEECDRLREGVHGWCGLHLRDWRASGLEREAFRAVADPRPFTRRHAPGPCLAECCDITATVAGWCSAHHQQWKARRCAADFAQRAQPVAVPPPCKVIHCEYPASRPDGDFCRSHFNDWRRLQSPDLATFVLHAKFHGRGGAYLLHGLPPVLTLELQYVLQQLNDLAWATVPTAKFNRLTQALREQAAGPTSVLDQSLEYWLTRITHRGSQTLIRFAVDQLRALAEEGVDEWSKDRWDLRRLGLHGAQTGRELRFDPIIQLWLRETAKRWVRHNLSRNRSIGTVVHQILATRQFSAYLAEVGAAADSGAQLTRALLEGFLSWMLRTPLHPRTRNRRIGCIKVFIQDCRRFEWAPIPPTAVFYLDDFSKVEDAKPRALSEHVMVQLEKDGNLALLADDGTRAVVTVLMRTGIRVGDLIRLPFNPMTYDAGEAPYLDFYMHKLKKEHRIPLDAVAEQAVRRQQEYVTRRWPSGSPWLFPGIYANASGTRHFAYATVVRRIEVWVEQCQVLDERGQPVRITPHQFRHTLGTRMINEGVAQHVVQRLYGHESPQMTTVYARLTDKSLRQAFDEWSSKRVNIHGHVVLHDPGDEAAWLKERLARAKQTLPNGYCGRPLQQICPHPNACLTCDDFLTDGQFLDQHRDQLNRTRNLIAAGHACGNQRLVEMNQRVETNLTRVIDSIERLESS